MAKVHKLSYYFYLIILALNLTSVFTHNLKKCGHHLKAQNNTVVKVNYNGNEKGEVSKLRFLQATWEPIKIYIDYTQLDSQTTVDITKRSIVKQVVEATKPMFEKLIMVKRLSTKVAVTVCNNDLTIISPTVQSGVDADVVIFPIFDFTAGVGVEAASIHCNIDSITNRPTAGVLYYSESAILTDKKNYLDYLVMLSFHELTHLFVFNTSHYQNFIDSSGVVIPFNKTIGVETINGVEKTLIISPKVLATAKSHYGCSKMIGVELESQGGVGTMSAHWEMRTMFGEYMIGETYEESVISEITLALFEDSGWYKVNYYTGGLFRTGKYKGCDFLLSKCIINEKSNFPSTFCTESGASMCTPSRMGKGICNLFDNNTGTTVPTPYQYFSSGKIGTVKADYCPISINIFSATAYYGDVCYEGISTLPASLNETIGADSACFYSSIKDNFNSEQAAIPQKYSICYKYVCDNTSKRTLVFIGPKQVSCPKEGGPIDVTIGTMLGKLWCPDYNLLCTKSVPCLGPVDCVFKGSSPLSPVYDYIANATSPYGLDTGSAATPIPSPVPGGWIGIGNPSPSPFASSNRISILSAMIYILFIGIII